MFYGRFQLLTKKFSSLPSNKEFHFLLSIVGSTGLQKKFLNLRNILFLATLLPVFSPTRRFSGANNMFGLAPFSPHFQRRVRSRLQKVMFPASPRFYRFNVNATKNSTYTNIDFISCCTPSAPHPHQKLHCLYFLAEIGNA